MGISCLICKIADNGAHAFEDVVERLLRLGLQHRYARLAEIGDAFEKGSGGEVAADMEDAAIFIDALKERVEKARQLSK